MIRLRPLEPSDLGLFYSVTNDTALWDTVDSPLPYSRHALERYILSLSTLYESREMRLVIEHLPDNLSGEKSVPVGLVDLSNYDPQSARAEIGIVVLRQYRQSGYARQALLLLENYAHDHLRIHSLYAYVSKGNTSSVALFTAAGYIPLAQIPDWHYHEGVYEAALLFQKILTKK